MSPWRRWRAYWAQQRQTSTTSFALGLALLWVLVYNAEFWRRTLEAMWSPDRGSLLFLPSLFVLVWFLQASLLLIVPGRLALRIAASVFCVAAACSAYFCNEYGAVMNKDMLRNVLETDTAEVAGLLNARFLLYVVFLGVLPLVAIWRIPLRVTRWQVALQQRLLVCAVAVGLCGASMLVCSADYAVFFREFKPIRFTMIPVSPLFSLGNLLSEQPRQRSTPLLNPAGRTVLARQMPPGPARPRVLLLVVGETARAANFQLGGYARATNPQLAQVAGLWFFPQTTSCGTSTAWSVPCMFSHLDRENFKLDEARRYTNLLDALAMGGYTVEWRDNNAGCKGVCARATQVSYADHADRKLCRNSYRSSYCYDEVMLSDLEARLQSLQHDTVIVFHQIGSHGPAYAERYPSQFEHFRPACHSNELQHCTQQEIINAYDNSILYTDHFLARQIALLQRFADRLDGALIYASDHGESLGEQGIYLHGMPYRFAPDVQKSVPMLIWLSPGFTESAHLRPECLRERTQGKVSHDYFYHTVLGMAALRNDVYDSSLDLLAGCSDSGVLSANSGWHRK